MRLLLSLFVFSFENSITGSARLQTLIKTWKAKVDNTWEYHRRLHLLRLLLLGEERDALYFPFLVIANLSNPIHSEAVRLSDPVIVSKFITNQITPLVSQQLPDLPCPLQQILISSDLLLVVVFNLQFSQKMWILPNIPSTKVKKILQFWGLGTILLLLLFSLCFLFYFLLLHVYIELYCIVLHCIGLIGGCIDCWWWLWRKEEKEKQAHPPLLLG